MKLQQYINDPTPNIALLTQLKSDTSLYVRRSVANHLNDIAKDNPEVVLDLCQQWLKGATPEVNWVIKHATRTLVKQGEPRVFALLGYTDNPDVECSTISLSTPSVTLGESIGFNFTLKSTTTSKQNFVVDFAVYFVKANGEQKAKVFKLKNVNLRAMASVELSKTISFKAISTRKYYSGSHRIEILVNGEPQKQAELLVNEK